METRTVAAGQCPVCEGAWPLEFLRRRHVPVHQNLLLRSAAAACGLPRGELTMVLCTRCGFAHNATFDPDLLNYGAAFDNTQTCSPIFSRHVDGLVNLLVENRGVRGRRVVEVGCGKGTFLKRLVEYPGADNVGFGFDPAYVGPNTDLDGRLHFCRHFYGRGSGPAADVIVCRHVIEHIQAPLDLLRSMRAGLAGSADGRLFVETPCLEWILRHQVAWDFFYEHCSLFTAGSLAEVLTRAGFAVISVDHIFDGQYLWVEARAGAGWDAQANSPSAVVDLARRLGGREREQVQAWRERLRQLRAAGAVAVWGAGAKGATFCNLADPDCATISCVVDVNPAKQGNYVAGTGHPIIAPEQLDASVRTVVVLNPNYTAEVADRLAVQGSGAAVVDLMRASLPLAA